MKTEFSEQYDEFFTGAIGELQKTVIVKLYAMDLCNGVFCTWVQHNSIGFPVYDV